MFLEGMHITVSPTLQPSSARTLWALTAHYPPSMTGYLSHTDPHPHRVPTLALYYTEEYILYIALFNVQRSLDHR